MASVEQTAAAQGLTAGRLDEIEKQSIVLSTREIAAAIFAVMGEAGSLMAGRGDAKRLGRYARGEREPHAVAERRLRVGYQALKIVEATYGPGPAARWMGNMAMSDDSSPILTLADNDPAEVGRRVLSAATHFASD